MAENEMLYFDRPGREHTDAVIEAVKKRAGELNIRFIVVASNSGDTSLKFCKAFKDNNIKIVSVTEHAGFSGRDEVQMTAERRRELEARRAITHMSSHALSGIERSISNKFGGISHVEIIAASLRLFGCEGIKVAVEVSVMAADAGLVPTDEEIIAVGGTSRGADTAVVIKTAHMNNFFDLEVREIIAKPRQRRE